MTRCVRVRGIGASVLLLSLAIPAQDSWGPLPAGPDTVGFRTEIRLDRGRRYRTELDDGATYGGSGKAARPILVNLWYPAVPSDTPPMPYRAYFDIGSDDPDVDRFAQAISAYAADVSATEMLGKAVADLDDVEGALWRRFLDLSTRAHPDAAPRPGPFPCVVYHSGAGSSFEDNSAFCEYLASHGYVVVGSAYPAANGRRFGVDAGDGSVRDMEFLARYVGELPYVDWRHIAFAGHSAGAQASMRAMLRPDCPADALVLFDSTADYYSLRIPNFRYLTEPALQQPGAYVRPMLVIAGPEATFEMCDQLTAADRTYLTVPELGHNEFILQGVLRLRVQGWLQEARSDSEGAEARARDVAREPDVVRLFVETCEAARLFLDAELCGARGPCDARWAAWAKNALGGAAPRVALAPAGQAGPAPYDPSAGGPPSPRQLRQVMAQRGVEGLIASLESHRDREPQSPVYDSTMLWGSVLYDLAATERLDDAKALHAWLAEIGVDGTSALRFLARMEVMSKRNDRAQDMLRVALSINPKDARALQKMAELEASPAASTGR
ncbi:MAG: hypothetical protein AAF628_25650 [Planctomycetota bacterium]